MSNTTNLLHTGMNIYLFVKMSTFLVKEQALVYRNFSLDIENRFYYILIHIVIAYSSVTNITYSSVTIACFITLYFYNMGENACVYRENTSDVHVWDITLFIT